MGRYEDYNEMLYEAYCKAFFKRAFRMALSMADEWEPELPDKPLTYRTQGQAIQVKDQKLGQALSKLLPKDREIILLYYFLGLRDEAVAKRLNMSRATVQRRREKAQKKLKMILEESP